jgi:hypothetical protein
VRCRHWRTSCESSVSSVRGKIDLSKHRETSSAISGASSVDSQRTKTVLRRTLHGPSANRGYPTSLAPRLQLQKATDTSISTRRAPTPRKSRKSLSRPRRDAPPSIRFGRQPARKIPNTASTPLAIARPYRIPSSAELRVGPILICEVERRCGSRCLRAPPKTVKRTLSATAPSEVVKIPATMQRLTG